MTRLPKNSDSSEKAVANDALFGSWESFETAPQDGTHILVWGKELERRGTDFTVAHYRDGHWHLSLNLCCGPVGEPLIYANNQPTHWMPLPSPPNDQALAQPGRNQTPTI